MKIEPNELKRRKAEIMWTPWTDKSNPAPDWICPNGGKFWLDASITEYARTKQESYCKMPAIDGYVYFVELGDGTKTRVLYIKQTPVSETASYETMLTYIDQYKLIKKFK